MKFSITIPTYKKKYLAEAIESVLSQTYSDFELIIVNDASPENIDSIISQYNDTRIKYFKNKYNCGAINVVDNWNICLEHASGEFLICMGDDDKLLPNCLEEYNQLIKKYPSLAIYHGRTEIIDENSHFYKVTSQRPEFETVYSLIWHRWTGRTQFIGDFLFNVQYLRQVKGFYKLPLAWASDDISAVISASLNGIANTQKIVFQYRENAKSITNSGNAKVKIDAIEQEFNWYKCFLATNIPADEENIKFKQSVKILFPKHFLKKKIHTISKDLCDCHFTSVIYWAKRYKKYRLTASQFAYCLIDGLKKCMTKS